VAEKQVDEKQGCPSGVPGYLRPLSMKAVSTGTYLG
jgi:hypothetical protein